MHTDALQLTSSTSLLQADASVSGVRVAWEDDFSQLIMKRTGIFLQSHQLTNLRDTVRKACERFGFQDAVHYLEVLQQSALLTPPFEYLIAGITVGESYFFRDSDQMDLLQNQLLPEMIAAKRASGNLSLRIWSAGCSQGQEIYSVAMMLVEMIPDIAKWHIHLKGTDINNEVVARAIQGRYTEWSFRTLPNKLKDKWFTRVGSECEIHPKIRGMVRFGFLNLTDETYPSLLNEANALDLILCRNVFIYLNPNAVQHSMSSFARCLVDNGILILGAADPVYDNHADLCLVQNNRTGYFRKMSNFSATLPPTLDAKVQAASVVSDSTAGLPKGGDVTSNSFSSGSQISSDAWNKLIALLNKADWHVALVKVDEMLQISPKNSELWQMKAKVLANTGDLADALTACRRSIKLDPVNKSSHFLMGMVLAELDRLPEAAEAFRKTLYLDHAFLEAHYELGMLRVRAKDLTGAFKSLENALRLAEKGNASWRLHHASGMTYGRFAQVLKNEIEMLRGAVVRRQ